jgi:hypothetical protein
MENTQMGMYDNIICNFPLEGEDNKLDGWQTKDLQCLLETFTITEDGRLLNSEGKEDLYTGTIDFYMSNWAAHAHGVSFTANGEDLRSVEYRAEFKNGVLLELEKTQDESKPALPSSELYGYKKGLKKTAKESPDFTNWLGKRLYMPSVKEAHPDLFTDEDTAPSVTVTVVYADKDGAVVKHPDDGLLEVVHPFLYGSVYYDSYAHFQEVQEERERSKREAEDHFKALLEQRKVTQ